MEGIADGTASGYEDSQTTEKKTKINQLNTMHFTEEYRCACFWDTHLHSDPEQSNRKASVTEELKSSVSSYTQFQNVNELSLHLKEERPLYCCGLDYKSKIVTSVVLATNYLFTHPAVMEQHFHSVQYLLSF